jgi:hypothetical protein
VARQYHLVVAREELGDLLVVPTVLGRTVSTEHFFEVALAAQLPPIPAVGREAP